MTIHLLGNRGPGRLRRGSLFSVKYYLSSNIQRNGLADLEEKQTLRSRHKISARRPFRSAIVKIHYTSSLRVCPDISYGLRLRSFSKNEISDRQLASLGAPCHMNPENWQLHSSDSPFDIASEAVSSSSQVLGTCDPTHEPIMKP